MGEQRVELVTDDVPTWKARCEAKVYRVVTEHYVLVRKDHDGTWDANLTDPTGDSLNSRRIAVQNDSPKAAIAAVNKRLNELR